MSNALVLICTVVMLSVYLVQANRARARRDHGDPDHFFLSRGAHSKEEYGSTQTAYFLQMATVYPFFLFGFMGSWWLGVWNTIFYVVGILVFMWVLPRCNDGILNLVGRSSTPHALIAAAHDMPALRIFASFLSISAFIGLALFETVWGTAALKAVLGGNSYLYYLSIAVFALFLVSVLWTGGQRGAIKNAQVQLLLAYIGLHMLTGWALQQHGSRISETDAPILFPVIFLAGSIAVLKRVLNWRQDGSRQLKILNLFAIASLCWVLIAIARAPDLWTTHSLSWRPIVLPDNAFLMLVTMGCLPIFFQFVDMTNWQRLSSLSGNAAGVIKDAKAGLRFFLLESPLSWLFPIAIGMSAMKFLIVPEGGDAWVAFTGYVTSLPGPIGAVLAIAAVIGILCVFLSTADALLSASGYAFAYDVAPKSRRIMDQVHEAHSEEGLSAEERRSVIHAGNYATTAAILVAVGLYIAFDAISPDLGNRLLGFFLTFYAPMLSFAPSMLVPILTGKAASRWVALASMMTSALLGVGIGIYSLFSADAIWQWLGVPVCFVVSWAIYLIGFAIWSRSINDPADVSLEAGARV